MKSIETIIRNLRVAMTDARQNESHFESWMILNEAICDAIDALAEQPAQQPVVEHPPCQGMNCGITRTDQEHSLECQAEHAAAIAGGAFVKPAQQQEPVAWRHDMGEENGGWEYFEQASCPDCQPLYTTPPHRKPLTDEEIETIWQNTSPYYDHQDFARDIEAAHGIKEKA